MKIPLCHQLILRKIGIAYAKRPEYKLKKSGRFTQQKLW